MLLLLLYVDSFRIRGRGGGWGLVGDGIPAGAYGSGLVFYRDT
jgi:hypothetical protein